MRSVTRRGRWMTLTLVLLAIAGLALLAGCETGSAPEPTPVSAAAPTQVTQTARLRPTFTPVSQVTATPLPTATNTPPPAPTAAATPAATDTPAPTATPTTKPKPKPTKKPPPPTTPPFEYMPDGDVRHESNPSFTQIQGTVRGADGTPLNGVIVVLNTGQLIRLPTGPPQPPGYYSWNWVDWSRDGTFELYILGADGQPASPRVTVHTYEKDRMSIAIQDWKRTR